VLSIKFINPYFLLLRSLRNDTDTPQISNLPEHVETPDLPTTSARAQSTERETEQQSFKNDDDDRAKEKLLLKQYLNEFNYNLVRKTIKLPNRKLDTRNLVKEFKDFVKSSKIQLKYLCNYLFHISNSRFNHLLLRSPSWKVCRNDSKVIFCLINKFMQTKDETLKKMNLFYKNYKTVRLPKQTVSAFKSKNEHDFQTTRLTNTVYWKDYMKDVIVSLVVFLNKNSISSDLFAKKVLNISGNQLSELISNKNNLQLGCHKIYVRKIVGFLEDKKIQLEIINENKQVINHEEDDDDDDDDSKVYSRKIFSRSSSSSDDESTYEINEEENFDIEIRPESRQNDDSDENSCRRRRSARSSIRNGDNVIDYSLKEISEYPYDVSNVYIEGKCLKISYFFLNFIKN
jgi:hypothetical protein